jgi:hypothetical protein
LSGSDTTLQARQTTIGATKVASSAPSTQDIYTFVITIGDTLFDGYRNTFGKNKLIGIALCKAFIAEVTHVFTLANHTNSVSNGCRHIFGRLKEIISTPVLKVSNLRKMSHETGMIAVAFALVLFEASLECLRSEGNLLEISLSRRKELKSILFDMSATLSTS